MNKLFVILAEKKLDKLVPDKSGSSFVIHRKVQKQTTEEVVDIDNLLGTQEGGKDLRIADSSPIDNQQMLEWRMTSPGEESARDPGRSPGKNWRLPSIEELRALNKQLGTGWKDNLKILGWPLVNESVPYLSSDSYQDKNNMRHWLGYDLATSQEIDVYELEEVRVVWVKKSN